MQGFHCNALCEICHGPGALSTAAQRLDCRQMCEHFSSVSEPHKRAGGLLHQSHETIRGQDWSSHTRCLRLRRLHPSALCQLALFVH